MIIKYLSTFCQRGSCVINPTQPHTQREALTTHTHTDARMYACMNKPAHTHPDMHAYNGASHTKFAVIRSVCNQSGRVPDCVCNSILISPCWTVKCRLQQMSHVSPGVLCLSLSLSLCIWGLLSSLLTPRLHLHHPKKTHSHSRSRFHCHSLCSAIVIVVVIIIALAHHATAASALAYANVII